jgi:hypothetical protein
MADESPGVGKVSNSAEKPKNTYRNTVIYSAAAIILVVLAIAGYTTIFQKVDCKAIINKSTPMIQKKEYGKAYDVLNSDAKACTENSSQSYETRIEYGYRVATTSYETGNKEQAKSYATKALALYSGLTPQASSKIHDELNLSLDLTSLSQGDKYYYSMRDLQ